MSFHYFPLKIGAFQGLVYVDLSFRVSFRDRLGVATACFDPVTGRVGRNVS